MRSLTNKGVVDVEQSSRKESEASCLDREPGICHKQRHTSTVSPSAYTVKDDGQGNADGKSVHFPDFGHYNVDGLAYFSRNALHACTERVEIRPYRENVNASRQFVLITQRNRSAGH